MQDPHHIYLDLDVINNNYTQEGPKPYLRFEETRNTPFLDGDSSEYFCSIVRFSIQTGNTLPVFVPSIKLGQNNINETIYKVSLRCVVSGVAYIATTPIIYSPEDATAAIPAPPMIKQDMSSTYYYVHNYSHFINLINIALDTSYNTLRASIPKEFHISPVDATTAPFLDFDTTLNRVVLYADNVFYSFSSTEVEFETELDDNPRVQIYFNERLYNLFVGLPYTYMTKQGDLNYKLKIAESRAGLFQKTVTDMGEANVGGVIQPTVLTKIQICDGPTRNI